MAMDADAPPKNSSWIDAEHMFGPSSIPLHYVVTALLALVLLYSFRGPKNKVHMVNPKRLFELTTARAKKDYVVHGHRMLQDWFGANPSQPVRFNADFDELVVLPPSMADEIRNDPRLSFGHWSAKSFHSHIPGFDGFRETSNESGFVQAVIVKDLTKHLEKVIEPLAKEAATVIPEALSDSPEWHAVPLRDTLFRVIARVSCRVFLGEELCRNEDWLRITRDYTVYALQAAEKLRLWPAATRPFVHWFLPSCRKIRGQIAQARAIINPVLEERRQLKARLRAEGKPAEVQQDAIEWFEQEARGSKYDPVSAQLLLAAASIHTTADLVCEVMTHLAQNPEIMGPLRREMVECLQQHGWTKAALYNMKLLDSVIKESQRVKPIGSVAMRRVALADVELSNGLRIPKGGTLAVSSHSMWDPAVYEKADEWDGYRFFNMRHENPSAGQLVTTSPEHLGFGHGNHACPGRFYATIHMKVSLVYLLLRYDWELPRGVVPKRHVHGFSLRTDPLLKMEVRRRKEEMEI